MDGKKGGALMPATVNTYDELIAWLEGHTDRHQKRGDGCSCGWSVPVLSDATQEEHAAACVLSDLGDVLPSDTWDGSTNTPDTWREDSRWIAGCVDWRDANCTCDRDAWPEPA